MRSPGPMREDIIGLGFSLCRAQVLMENQMEQ